MSFYSYGTKSMGGFALTLASKINMALSRMGGLNDEDEDMHDLIALLDELN
jgi:hypothetical protein